MAERQGAVCSGFLSLAQAAEPRLRPATRLACPCSSIANALAVGNKGDFPCQTHARVQTSAPPPALAHPPPAIATHQPMAPMARYCSTPSNSWTHVRISNKSEESGRGKKG